MLPAVGYRQWVLSFGGPLAVRLGYDEELLAKVAESVARAAMQDVAGRWRSATGSARWSRCMRACEVQAFLGHANIATTQAYPHTDSENLDHAMLKVARGRGAAREVTPEKGPARASRNHAFGNNPFASARLTARFCKGIEFLRGRWSAHLPRVILEKFWRRGRRSPLFRGEQKP